MSDILFSPVGNTDPMKYDRDGSLLHIIRHYSPDKIILYMSHEILEHHRNDDRYCFMIRKLGELKGKEYDVQIIEDDAMTDPQEYDSVYGCFDPIIRKLHNSLEPGDRLLLNIASGTPAMKSALLVISNMMEYNDNIFLLQVRSPNKSGNTKQEKNDPYDVSLLWENNKDNEEDCENRCGEPIECHHMVKLIKIKEIIKLISAYDYEAAHTISKDMGSEISRESADLLEIAALRFRLDEAGINKIDSKDKNKLFPVKLHEKKRIFEYALSVDIKRRRGDYADFLRAITPLVVDMFEIILRDKFDVNISEYMDPYGKWDIRKLNDTRYKMILDEKYNGFNGGFVYSDHLASLIEKLSNDPALKKDVTDLRSAEEKVRNKAAHEIVSVNDKYIKSMTGKSAAEIFAMIKRLISQCGIRADDNAWNSYDDMNRKIIKSLESIR